MVVSQATRNPFEVERIRLQRSIDRIVGAASTPSQGGPDEKQDRLDLLKEGLRRLMAAGATSPDEAAELVGRIMQTARNGTKVDLETMKIWPADETKARPAAEFFVNERIDLLVREAETFRNDYRNTEARNVFLALKKPLPFVSKQRDRNQISSDLDFETQRYSGSLLILLVIGCGIATSIILYAQNRRTS